MANEHDNKNGYNAGLNNLPKPKQQEFNNYDARNSWYAGHTHAQQQVNQQNNSNGSKSSN